MPLGDEGPGFAFYLVLIALPSRNQEKQDCDTAGGKRKTKAPGPFLVFFKSRMAEMRQSGEFEAVGAGNVGALSKKVWIS